MTEHQHEAPVPLTDEVPAGATRLDAGSGKGRPSEDHDPGTSEGSTRFGHLGRPLNPQSPFRIGFTGALGALLAYYLLQLISNLSSTLTLVTVALFLAMGLDPIVKAMEKRGVRRGVAVLIVFLGVLLVVAGFLAVVVPTLVTQGTQLAQSLPDTITNLQKSDVVRRLNEDFGIIDNASNQIKQKLSDGQTLTQIFGGVFGAGRAVLSGTFTTFTVLVLTLYFLASLRTITESAYRLAPASRRARVRLLTDEIIRRIGGYVAGQVSIASLNGLLTYFLLLILDVPFALVLAITVALFGLIPLVGATIGAAVVALVGFFQGWQTGVTIVVYYLIYQQIENYVIAPRVMSRTVQVPGAIAVVAALAGGSLLGILGALIAIPVAAAILLIIEEIVIPRQQRS